LTLSVPQRELLTVAETAQRLHVSVRTVRRLIARGDLVAVQLGGRGAPVRIDPDELDRWLYGDPEQAA
jgi:excisionase family DNA binding protein